VIGRVKHWRSWAARLIGRHARTFERRGLSMMLLRRSAPVILTHVTLRRCGSVVLSPRISAALSLDLPSVRVAEPRDVERTVVVQRVPGRLIHPPAASTPVAAAEAARQVALSTRYFVSRTAVDETSIRLLRRSRIDEALETRTFTRRSTSEVALEHATLLKRRLQREETTLTLAAREVRQNVVKNTPPAKRGEQSATPAPAERLKNWPAAPQQPPMPTLDSITDHVIRQFDRKLTAHRERMGRV